MSSLVAEPFVLLGAQRPRLSWVPPYVSTSGPEAIDLAFMAGLDLDDWQQWILTEALGEREDGKWAALEVGVVISRQNGKGGTLEARELAGLFLIEDERLVIHSAHEFATSLEAFERLLGLIEDTPQLSKRIAKRGVSRAHGSEGIRLRDGKRIKFKTRTKSAGRGFTGDCVIMDEAMVLPRAMHGALMPTLSAVPNPQLWYTGSAVDEDIQGDDGLVLAKIRERGMAARDPRLAYFEWSVDSERYGQDPAGVSADPASWAEANPALGIRVSPEYVAAEQRSMDARTFSVERLGVGRWPKTDDETEKLISKEAWDACLDPQTQIASLPVFGIDVTPDRKHASICVAGLQGDKRTGHVEVVSNLPGTGWVVNRCVELKAAWPKSEFVLDPKSPAATLVKALAEAKIPMLSDNKRKPVEMTGQDIARACGEFYDAVTQRRLCHGPQPELAQAVIGAATRPLGDMWAWSRRESTVDISPLVACTLALWGAQQKRSRPRVVNMAEAVRRDAERRRAAGPD